LLRWCLLIKLCIFYFVLYYFLKCISLETIFSSSFDRDTSFYFFSIYYLLLTL
jgi:hypothetical protein